MADELTPCSVCHRHVRASDAACPFCGAHLAAPVEPRAPRTVALACAALAGLMAPANNANAQLRFPRENMEHGPAAAYGAPPPVTPLEGHPTGEPEVVVDATVRGAPTLAPRVRFALSRERESFGRCLAAAPHRGPRETSVPIAFDLGPTGAVSNARTPGDRSPAAACVAGVLARLHVPRNEPRPQPVHVDGRVAVRPR